MLFGRAELSQQEQDLFPRRREKKGFVMKYDYHMHFEYGDYDVEWVKGFFEAAARRGLDEIGITEHTHTFQSFSSFTMMI